MKPRNNSSNSNNNPNYDATLVPQGAHTARIVLIAFIGGLLKTFQGKESVKDTILVTFELTDEEREYQDAKYKMVITKEYGFNYASKGFFRRDIEAILARTLTDNEVDYNSANLFDPATLLDTPVMITVTHEPWESKGKSGINVEVAAVSAIPEKMKAHIPPAQRSLINFDMSKYTALADLKSDDTYNKLNKFVKMKIEQTNDWKALVEMDSHNNPPATNQAPINTPITNQNVSSEQMESDDLPF